MGPGMGLDRDIDLSIHFLTVFTSYKRQHFRSDGAGFDSFTRGMSEFIHHDGYIIKQVTILLTTCLFFKSPYHKCEQTTGKTCNMVPWNAQCFRNDERLSISVCTEAAQLWNVSAHEQQNMRLGWYFCSRSRGMIGAYGLAESVSLRHLLQWFLRRCGYTVSELYCTVLRPETEGRLIFTGLFNPKKKNAFEFRSVS